MWDYIVPPLMGAFVGWITNWVAIKMLFWPREEVKIWGRRLPLTPGLFVKRRREFAHAVGALVEERFVTGAELVRAFADADDKGLVTKFVNEAGFAFRFVFNYYFIKTEGKTFKDDCEYVVNKLRGAHVIADVLENKISAITSEEIEAMVFAIVKKEFDGITWSGAVLGFIIGVVQLGL